MISINVKPLLFFNVFITFPPYFISKFFGYSNCRILVVIKALAVPSFYLRRPNEIFMCKNKISRALCNPYDLDTVADRYLGSIWKDWIPAFAGMTKLLVLCGTDKLSYLFGDNGLPLNNG